MSDGRRQILGPFTGRQKRKAWNKTGEKYMPVEIRQILAETDMGIILQSRGMVRRILGK